MTFEERLDEMLAELVEVGSVEEYHRMRADLYASVLIAVTVKDWKVTKQRIVELAREALVAEGYNPEFKAQPEMKS